MTTAIAIKELPILMKAEMVCAVQDDRKTQTRRVIKPQPESTELCPAYVCCDAAAPSGFSFSSDMIGDIPLKCPYGQPGDRLWVRETWRPFDGEDCRIEYRAGGVGFEGDPRCCMSHLSVADAQKQMADEIITRWRPSIFMPRWASRINLEITEVRVERVQEINREDAIAEGVNWQVCPTYQTIEQAMNMVNLRGCSVMIDYVAGFHKLRDSINAKRGYLWASNPYVWVISFRKLTT